MANFWLDERQDMLIELKAYLSSYVGQKTSPDKMWDQLLKSVKEFFVTHKKWKCYEHETQFMTLNNLRSSVKEIILRTGRSGEFWTSLEL